MPINLKLPEIKELKPKITVFGVGGAGGNAVNNMIRSGLEGCEFVVANTDSQALLSSKAERLVQMGVAVTEGLGAGSQPDIGKAAAEEAIDEINDYLAGSHMVFVTAGMGGGTGTGAAPIIARTAREHGVLTVGVVTKPFHFEGARRMRVAEAGIIALQEHVDTLIVIPNQNLFRIANEKTTFADAFAMADQVLYSGVACITDLMVKEGLINLDFADVRSVMREMGKAMMGTGEASGNNRAIQAAEAAIANPLLDETSMRGAKGLLISITGGRDLTLFEVDEAATRIREEVDPDANIILGATFEESLEGVIRCSVVATGIEGSARQENAPSEQSRTKAVGRAPALGERSPSATARPAASILRPAGGAGGFAGPQASTTSRAAAAEPDNAARIAPTTAQPSASDPAVSIQPLRQVSAQQAAPAPDLEAPAPAKAESEPPEGPFIPAPVEMPPRSMPRVEDFPAITQREMTAKRSAPAPEEDRGPLSLLRRLANASLGRREEDPPFVAPLPRQQQAAPAQGQRPTPPAQPPAQPAPPVASRLASPRAGAAESIYQPRREGDANGRSGQRPAEEEHLEIPAFLRRQAN
ncbi:MAG: cell division protein FtsZ [Bauldia sp.]